MASLLSSVGHRADLGWLWGIQDINCVPDATSEIRMPKTEKCGTSFSMNFLILVERVHAGRTARSEND